MPNAMVQYYRNLRVRTTPHGHEAAFAVLEQAGLTRDDSIIDLGAGEGAFVARLHDAGYTEGGQDGAWRRR